MSKPTFIRFNLEHNDEEEMTCFFCTLPKCDQCFVCAGGGGKKMVGVHDSCVEKHMEKQSQLAKKEG
jgi:hypothetical protein